MAANLSKVAVMGSCINGHVVQNDSAMSEPITGQEKVAILDAGAQYGKVRFRYFAQGTTSNFAYLEMHGCVVVSISVTF